MFLFLFELLGGIRGAIVATAAAALAWGALTLHHTLFVHPGIHRAGVAEGKAAERLAWEIQMSILRAAYEAELKKAQAEIDLAALQHLEQRDRDVSRIQALEAVIAQESTDEKDNACPDRPAIPGGVSTQLDAIGR